MHITDAVVQSERRMVLGRMLLTRHLRLRWGGVRRVNGWRHSEDNG